MISSEFFVSISANESVLTLLIFLIPGLWATANLIMIGMDFMFWFIVILKNYLNRTSSVQLIFRQLHESDSEGIVKEIRNDWKILFGNYPMNLIEKLFIIYGFFIRLIYVKDIPWEDKIKIDFMKIRKAIFSNEVHINYLYKEEEKRISKEEIISPGLTLKIPKSEEYIFSLKIVE